MKKLLLLIGALFTVVIVTGCGKNNTKVLVCNGNKRENNMSAQGEYRYTFKNDKLSSLKFVATFKDITVDDLDSVWDSFKAQFNEQNYPTEVSGYKRTTKADDKKHTFTVTLNIDFEKISKETMQKFEIDEELVNKTYDEVKKQAIEDSFTCK